MTPHKLHGPSPGILIIHDFTPTLTSGDDAMADQIIDLRVDHDDGMVIVTVTGEVDMLSAPLLSSRITRNLPRRGVLVIDLSQVSFLGSSGLQVLVEARAAAGRRDTELRLVCATRAVIRPLTTTGLGEIFRVYDSLDQALA